MCRCCCSLCVVCYVLFVDDYWSLVVVVGGLCVPHRCWLFVRWLLVVVGCVLLVVRCPLLVVEVFVVALGCCVVCVVGCWLFVGC